MINNLTKRRTPTTSTICHWRYQLSGPARQCSIGSRRLVGQGADNIWQAIVCLKRKTINTTSCKCGGTGLLATPAYRFKKISMGPSVSTTCYPNHKIRSFQIRLSGKLVPDRIRYENIFPLNPRYGHNRTYIEC